MKVVIYHNPSCGTSRKVLTALQDAGLEIDIIDYLTSPPDEKTLKRALKSMGKNLRDILRKRGTPFEELNLDNPKLDDRYIYAAIEKNPILIERPIVLLGDKAWLCRPAELVAEVIAAAKMRP
ncbi:MAG: arsenate reductase (glutaredoxin) [Methylocystaceae bacterium]|nr:arsenate reductase (glutaredoxin) [Methylocystaceae bacterium]